MSRIPTGDGRGPAALPGRRLGRRFFRRGAAELAVRLLGQFLVRVLEDGRRLAGRVVETEAYLGVVDQAAHSANGRRTRRNRSMYLDAGHAYVYFTYGMHYCFNVSADREEVPTACLIRALRPVEGLDAMRIHRADRIPAERLRETDLCSGPAKLTQALRIDGGLDGEDLVASDRLFFCRGPRVEPQRVVCGPRIGIGYAGQWVDKPLRFYLPDEPHVSVRN